MDTIIFTSFLVHNAVWLALREHLAFNCYKGKSKLSVSINNQLINFAWKVCRNTVVSILSTLFQLYCDSQFYLWRTPEYPKKKPTPIKSLTNLLSHNVVSSNPLIWAWFELTTTDTDFIDSKSNYHTITAMMTPIKMLTFWHIQHIHIFNSMIAYIIYVCYYICWNFYLHFVYRFIMRNQQYFSSCNLKLYLDLLITKIQLISWNIYMFDGN